MLSGARASTRTARDPRVMGFGPPGFLHAPASKAVMACFSLASVLVHTSPHRLSASRVSLTPRAVFGVGAHGRQLVSRLLLSNLAFASAGETLVGMSLWYRLARDAERRRGTDRYAAFLAFVAAFAVVAQVALIAFAFPAGVHTSAPFATGPHALVWAHLPGFARDVPTTWTANLGRAFGRESRVTSKTQTAVSFALLAWFATRASPSPNDADGDRSIARAGARLVPAALGTLAALALRAPWFPLNIEPRMRDAPRGRGGGSRVGGAFARRRWWPALVRASCSATLGWLTVDPAAARVGAPRVFVAGNSRERARAPRAPRADRSRRGFGAGPAAPPLDAVATLVAMGFDEGSARRALADAGNELSVAAERLLED